MAKSNDIFTTEQQDDIKKLDALLISIGIQLIDLYPQNRYELERIIADIRRNANNDTHGTGRHQS